jgi:hypothetical protein
VKQQIVSVLGAFFSGASHRNSRQGAESDSVNKLFCGKAD